MLFPNGILWDKEKDNYLTFDENEGLSIIARLSVNYKNKKEENSLENSSFVSSCKSLINYRTFKENFLKVVDFLHYLKAEGYDMVALTR